MENQTIVSNTPNGVSVVTVTPAPDIREFVRLVRAGAECWEQAGEVLVKLRNEDKFAFQKIHDEHPFITVEALEIFHHIGTKSLYPLVMLLPRDICAKVRTMRYEAQKAISTTPVEVVTRMVGDKPVIVHKSVAKLTSMEARTALCARGQVPVKAQIKAMINKITPPILPKPKPMLPKELERKPIARKKFAVRRGPSGAWIFEPTMATPYNVQRVMLEGGQAVIELCEWGGQVNNKPG